LSSALTIAGLPALAGVSAVVGFSAVFLRFCSWWLFVVVGVLLVVPIARVSVLLL